MSRWVAFWVSAITGLVLFDVLRDRRRDGSTLSECTRWVKDKIPHGDAVFTVTWMGFAGWFWQHILTRPITIDLDNLTD